MNSERIKYMYQYLLNIANQCNNMIGTTVVLHNDIVAIKNELTLISQDSKKINPSIGNDIFSLKDNLFTLQGTVNLVILGELIASLRILNNLKEYNSFWDMIHPSIIRVSKGLFDDGYYANASEDAFVEINARVKKLFITLEDDYNRVPDGVDLMNKVFSTNNPIISLGDINTETGLNIQKGYGGLFSGAMSAIRNPKAHENIVLEKNECKRNLALASKLMYKLDEAVRKLGVEE